MLLANFNRKEHLRHRAVSLRQHGFLVDIILTYLLTQLLMLSIIGDFLNNLPVGPSQWLSGSQRGSTEEKR